MTEVEISVSPEHFALARRGRIRVVLTRVRRRMPSTVLVREPTSGRWCVLAVVHPDLVKRMPAPERAAIPDVPLLAPSPRPHALVTLAFPPISSHNPYSEPQP